MAPAPFLLYKTERQTVSITEIDLEIHVRTSAHGRIRNNLPAPKKICTLNLTVSNAQEPH